MGSEREREQYGDGDGNGAGTGTEAGTGTGAGWTASGGRVGQRRTALDEHRRNGGITVNGRNGGNGGEVDIPNRIQEVA